MKRAVNPIMIFFSSPYVMMVFRIVLGGIFLLSGLFKLLESPDAFARIVETFQVIPPWIPPWFINGIRYVMSFAEIFCGLSVVMRWKPVMGLLGISILLSFFILLILSALVRGIEIIDCGCFGNSDLLKILGHTDREVLVRDGIMLVISGWLLYYEEQRYHWIKRLRIFLKDFSSLKIFKREDIRKT